MRNFLRAGSISVAVLALAASANAAGMNDMVGKWKWTDYTIECKAGGANGMSCVVLDGPKNKGMEMVQSKLEAKDGAFVGDIKHPATGDLYKAKMLLKDADNWSMDGCTAAGVCASGVFTRIK
ncbi:MAG: hypothetical protein WCD20_17485 [Rhodomicrobium sp.]